MQRKQSPDDTEVIQREYIGRVFVLNACRTVRRRLDTLSIKRSIRRNGERESSGDLQEMQCRKVNSIYQGTYDGLLETTEVEYGLEKLTNTKGLSILSVAVYHKFPACNNIMLVNAL